MSECLLDIGGSESIQKPSKFLGYSNTENNLQFFSCKVLNVVKKICTATLKDLCLTKSSSPCLFISTLLSSNALFVGWSGPNFLIHLGVDSVRTSFHVAPPYLHSLVIIQSMDSDPSSDLTLF